MQRFKKYIGKEVILDKFRDSAKIATFGVTCKSLPETLGDFEEIELAIDFVEQEILLAIAVLENKIKRIMFVQVDEEDPDACRPLTETQLKDLLEQKGEYLFNFFVYVTK